MTAPAELARIRADIERVDYEIIERIAERMRLARAVGETKHAAGLATLDHAHEAAVVRRAVERAREAGVTPDDAVRQIFWLLIGLCRRAQQPER